MKTSGHRSRLRHGVQQVQRQAKKAAGADSMQKGEARRDMLDENPKLANIARQTQQLVGQLQSAKLARAVTSERQLDEVMVDFWENHFSVFAGKGQTRLFLAEYDRDVIRPRALGKFRDLLGAVAKSPAMLFFLDNAQSAADSTQPTLVARNGRGGGRASAPASSLDARSAVSAPDSNCRRRFATRWRTPRRKSVSRSWRG